MSDNYNNGNDQSPQTGSEKNTPPLTPPPEGFAFQPEEPPIPLFISHVIDSMPSGKE